MRRFGYLHDGLFLLALSAYALNRLVVRPHFAGFLSTHLPWSWSFLHGHLDDLLLIPAALPVALWMQRLLKWRTHDQPTLWGEMAVHLIIWSVMCKLVGPLCLHIGVADPWDVLCFAAGGFAACAWWNFPGWAAKGSGHEF